MAWTSAQVTAGGTVLWCLVVSSGAPASPYTTAGGQPAPPAPAAASPHIVFRIDVSEITESSSLVVSSAVAGLEYTANDSSDGPYVYALDDAGNLVGTTTLRGVAPVDVEAMSGGSDGSLVVGDVGDNDADRRSIAVYKLSQPTIGDRTVTADKVTLTYADGPRDAESLLYDVESGAVLVVSKEPFAHVYSTPPDVFSHPTATLRRIATAPSGATDAAWLPANGAAVVRTYGRAYVYRYPSWRLMTSFPLPVQQQGESISNVPGRPRVVWAGTEGVRSPVWEVALPALPLVPYSDDPPTVAPSPASASSPATGPSVRVSPAPRRTGDGEGTMVGDDGTHPSRKGTMLVIGLGGLAVGAAILLSLSRRSR